MTNSQTKDSTDELEKSLDEILLRNVERLFNDLNRIASGDLTLRKYKPDMREELLALFKNREKRLTIEAKHSERVWSYRNVKNVQSNTRNIENSVWLAKHRYEKSKAELEQLKQGNSNG